jgi:hypothetical protein
VRRRTRNKRRTAQQTNPRANEHTYTRCLAFADGGAIFVREGKGASSLRRRCRSCPTANQCHGSCSPPASLSFFRLRVVRPCVRVSHSPGPVRRAPHWAKNRRFPLCERSAQRKARPPRARNTGTGKAKPTRGKKIESSIEWRYRLGNARRIHASTARSGSKQPPLCSFAAFAAAVRRCWCAACRRSNRRLLATPPCASPLLF